MAAGCDGHVMHVVCNSNETDRVHSRTLTAPSVLSSLRDFNTLPRGQGKFFRRPRQQDARLSHQLTLLMIFLFLPPIAIAIPFLSSLSILTTLGNCFSFSVFGKSNVPRSSSDFGYVCCARSCLTGHPTLKYSSCDQPRWQWFWK